MKNICDSSIPSTPHTAKNLSNSQTLKREAYEEKKRRARLPLDGFPTEGQFQSQAEVTAYFSGDKITCLLCGRAFKQLHVHLGSIHGVSENEYKTRYGLPFRTGLNCANLHERLSDIARSRSSHIARMNTLRDPIVCAERSKNQRAYKTRLPVAKTCARCGGALTEWSNGTRNGKPRVRRGCRKCQNERKAQKR